MSSFRSSGGPPFRDRGGGGVGGGNGKDDDPGSEDEEELIKTLQEQKLKSFSIGTMGKRSLSKKEQEELKKKQQEDEVGKVYREFVSTFEDTPQSKLSKTWVKAGTFNAGNRKEDATGKGQLYKPASRLDLQAQKEKMDARAAKEESLRAKRPEKPGSKKKEKEKKKSNLEMFKEELKAMQEERQERHKYKGMIKDGGGPRGAGGAAGGEGGRGERDIKPAYQDATMNGSHDTGDPSTTNLYLGNLSPRLTEQQMMELFGKYGPLASIKIMYPRTDEEKSRGKNCGFVAFMSRFDGERALRALSGKVIDNFDMKMGWGKPVPIPVHPIYIPPAMLRLTCPPPPSGLPFNAQPLKEEDKDRWNIGVGPIPTPADPEQRDHFNRLLYRSSIKVCIPTDRTQLCLINRMIEFVIREGPMFEAMIMNRELNNPIFSFLFENKSPEHTYYRWRLFSLLQGDSKDAWDTREFRMFKGGSVWKPPPVNLFTSGMDEELVEDSDDEKCDNRGGSDRRRGGDRHGGARGDGDRGGKPGGRSGGLSDSQRDRLEDMLRKLYPDRNPIAEIMIWCLDHADAGEEIVECITEALSILETPIAKKVARFYLISDLLHNCSIKGVPGVSFYRKGFQAKLPEIFADLNAYHNHIDSRIKAEAFKQRVLACFRAWEDWAIYPQDFLIKLQNIFLGLVPTAQGGNNGNNESGTPSGAGKETDDEVDGKSMSEDDDEDVDGVPLDGAALLKSAQQKSNTPTGGGGGGQTLFPKRLTNLDSNSDNSDSDVDGMPLNIPGRKPIAPAAAAKSSAAAPGFVPSKWETIDPEDVQAQAVTSSKWDFDDKGGGGKVNKLGIAIGNDDDDTDEEDIDGMPMLDSSKLDPRLAEDRRARLREIEIKVMGFQDELESGKKPSRPGWTISEQVEAYRRKLVRSTSSSVPAAVQGGGPSTPLSSSHYADTPTRRNHSRQDNSNSDDSDSEAESSSRSSRRKNKSSKKSKRSRRSRSSSRSRSRSPRDRSSRKSRRRRSSSSSPDDSSRNRKRSKRSRSRSRERKHKSKKSRH